MSSPSANPSAARSNARGILPNGGPAGGPAAGSAGRTSAAPGFAGLTGPALIRLLAQIGTGPATCGQSLSFAARLSHWLTWTDAIALSSALEPAAAAAVPAYQAPSTTPSPPLAGASAEEKETERVRAALAKTIARDEALTADHACAPLPRHLRNAPQNDKPAPLEFAPYRQAYLARQQSLQTAVGALRGRMRSALALASPGLARLAAIDAVMEQVLAPREHQLLATVPTLLERHFRRLRDAADDAAAGGPWLETFCQDMRAVLLAELELRFQPVDGLLQAQRERSHPDTRP